MASVRALLDTNVLIYATLEHDPRHGRARELVLGGDAAAGSELFISTQNLAEMWPTLTGPRTDPPDPPAVARAKIDAIAALPHLTVLPIDRETISLALCLAADRNVTRQDYYDMQIAGTMRQYGLTRIFTENVTDFGGLEGIEPINPFA